ncbi:hypothetical protein I316_02817 [Kwoniella heveanensis BCC8398]|uniref:Uncharacterized protein n=1 Tax=Kwoniella heveanensis BCC8398 TaxID=1296120 RepID=A0A1B9GW79_9TREE|nr:hypothetical protein I316_02817 [Kwoniella heveanensis BCC8398]
MGSAASRANKAHEAQRRKVLYRSGPSDREPAPPYISHSGDPRSTPFAAFDDDDILAHNNSDPPAPLSDQVIGKQQSNAVEKLPMEIWYMIIPHLRRKVGPVGLRNRDPDDYKQKDLASVMRVCKCFHLIAGPILYARVVTDSPAKLVYGLDHKPKLGGRFTKLQLLGFIRRLDLCYKRVEAHGKEAMKFRFASYNSYELGQSKLEKGLSLLVWDYKSSQKAGEVLFKLKGGKVFLNLEVVTTGAFGERPDLHWDPGYRLYPDELDRKGFKYRILPLEKFRKKYVEVSTTQQLAYQIYVDASPKHICTNDTIGPFALRSEGLIRAQIEGWMRPPISHTTHVYPRQVAEEMLMHIARGTLSRWVIDYTYFLDDASDPHRYEFTAGSYEYIYTNLGKRCWEVIIWLKRRIAGAQAKFNAQTAAGRGHADSLIEIYGVTEMEFIYQAWVYCNNRLLQPGQWDDDWTQDHLLNIVHGWLDLPADDTKIKLISGRSGRCPACGYSSF